MTDLVLGSLINQSGQFVFSNVIVSGGLQTSNVALTTGTTVGTGMYSPSNNTLSLTTNNAQQLTISSAGDVGINNPTPTNTTGYTTLQITNAVNGGLLRINNASQNYVRFVNSAGAFGGTVSGDPVITIVNNTERMRVTTLGNVGIGTVTPLTTLQVGGNMNANNFTTDPSGVIQSTNKTISAAYTIPTNQNAFSVGNITLSPGANVTVQPGTRWVIL